MKLMISFVGNVNDKAYRALVIKYDFITIVYYGRYNFQFVRIIKIKFLVTRDGKVS